MAVADQDCIISVYQVTLDVVGKGMYIGSACVNAYFETL